MLAVLTKLASWAIFAPLAVGFAAVTVLSLREGRRLRGPGHMSKAYLAAHRRAWDEQRWHQEERLRELYDQDQDNA